MREVERALHMELDPIPTTYYTTTSTSIQYNKPASGLVPAGNIYINGATSAVLSLNQVALDILYPNDTAKPIKASFGDSAMGGLSGNSIFNVRFQGVNIGSNISQGYNARQTIWQNDLAPPEVTDYNKTNTDIQFYIQSTSSWGAIFDWLELKLFFIQYDCAAVPGDGIANATVTNTTPYDGEQITFSATLTDGATFDGWYSDPEYTQLISTDVIYTTSASDLTLYAKAGGEAAKALTVLYDGQNIINETVTGDIKITYNGQTIATLSTGTQTLNCAGKIALTNISIGSKTLNCAGKMMATDINISLGNNSSLFLITNILSTSTPSLSGVTKNGTEYSYNAGGVSMLQQSLPTPIAGHKYYGRVEQKIPTGATVADGRFEYYKSDTPGELMAFTSFMNAINSGEDDNTYRLYSDILSIESDAASGDWVLRSFAVEATDVMYRRNPMIIDLTESFGAGNEPDKAWCDVNIPYVETSQYIRRLWPL